MAARADGDQPVALVEARLTMMHMEPIGGAASAAVAAVAVQDLVTKTREACPGVGVGAVAGAAEAGSPGQIPAAGAEQGALDGSGQESIVQQNCR